ncbi:hypothetical protein BpHYR1_032453 [Brachionus plicatilis]|uniref:Uncharacterized protein n=1 Tax=Brachionus plicatilis TaxID=10195 RepID=A0A3M7SU59_BRAPC|nr:hypothetical protein BpHYR1_032453 [Brachionus plicatilis]
MKQSETTFVSPTPEGAILHNLHRFCRLPQEQIFDIWNKRARGSVFFLFLDTDLSTPQLCNILKRDIFTCSLKNNYSYSIEKSSS